MNYTIYFHLKNQEIRPKFDKNRLTNLKKKYFVNMYLSIKELETLRYMIPILEASRGEIYRTVRPRKMKQAEIIEKIIDNFNEYIDHEIPNACTRNYQQKNIFEHLARYILKSRYHTCSQPIRYKDFTCLADTDLNEYKNDHDDKLRVLKIGYEGFDANWMVFHNLGDLCTPHGKISPDSKINIHDFNRFYQMHIIACWSAHERIEKIGYRDGSIVSMQEGLCAIYYDNTHDTKEYDDFEPKFDTLKHIQYNRTIESTRNGYRRFVRSPKSNGLMPFLLKENPDFMLHKCDECKFANECRVKEMPKMR